MLFCVEINKSPRLFAGSLQRGDGSEWQQDCLATLLKLMCQLGMLHSEQSHDSSVVEPTVTRSKQRRKKTSNLEKPVPKLNEAMLMMLNVDDAMTRLTSILYEASMPRDPNHYKTGFWGRAQVSEVSLTFELRWKTV